MTTNHTAEQGADTTTADVADLITEALFTETDGQAIDLQVRSYDEAGVLTSDDGLVLTINGAEFQVTIVRSR